MVSSSDLRKFYQIIIVDLTLSISMTTRMAKNLLDLLEKLQFCLFMKILVMLLHGWELLYVPIKGPVYRNLYGFQSIGLPTNTSSKFYVICVRELFSLHIGRCPEGLPVPYTACLCPIRPAYGYRACPEGLPRNADFVIGTSYVIVKRSDYI